MAMHAGLIAAIADIDLQRIQTPAAQRRERNSLEQGPCVAHASGLGEAPGGVKLTRANTPADHMHSASRQMGVMITARGKPPPRQAPDQVPVVRSRVASVLDGGYRRRQRARGNSPPAPR